MILACFMTVGNLPYSSERLIIWDKQEEICSAASHRNRAGMLSSPVAFVVFSSANIIFTLSSDTLAKWNEYALTPWPL